MQRGSCTEIGKSVCKNDRDLMAIKMCHWISMQEKFLESQGLQEMVRKNWQRLLPD